MEIGAGTGSLLDAIRALPSRPELYAFGTTQRLDGSLKVQKSGAPWGLISHGSNQPCGLVSLAAA